MRRIRFTLVAGILVSASSLWLLMYTLGFFPGTEKPVELELRATGCSPNEDFLKTGALSITETSDYWIDASLLLTESYRGVELRVSDLTNEVLASCEWIATHSPIESLRKEGIGGALRRDTRGRNSYDLSLRNDPDVVGRMSFTERRMSFSFIASMELTDGSFVFFDGINEVTIANPNTSILEAFDELKIFTPWYLSSSRSKRSIRDYRQLYGRGSLNDLAIPFGSTSGFHTIGVERADELVLDSLATGVENSEQTKISIVFGVGSRERLSQTLLIIASALFGAGISALLEAFLALGIVQGYRLNRAVSRDDTKQDE